jgi:hypothetical protein
VHVLHDVSDAHDGVHDEPAHTACIGEKVGFETCGVGGREEHGPTTK